MLIESSANLHPGELVEIVESVFRSMMGIEIACGSTPWVASAERLTSVVYLTGEWNGAVLVECDRRQACRFASRFLSSGADGDDFFAVDDVVRDVLGEIANMIGGNLKWVLSKGTRISMPSVIDGDFSMHVCGAEVRARLAFQCSEGVFWVALLTTRARPSDVDQSPQVTAR